MKKTLITLFLLTLLLCALGCTPKQQDPTFPPDTDLDFWVAQPLPDQDIDTVFQGYIEELGMFGGRQFYGKGYTPVTYPDDSDVSALPPEHYVLYTVTAYPDYADREQSVTRIWITDPQVRVLGLTLESTPEQIDHTMKEHGYEQLVSDTALLNYRQGNITVSFLPGEHINISVPVSNRDGIIF